MSQALFNHQTATESEGDVTESPRTIFLTGANGFVGSHLSRALVASGHHVRALVRATANRARVADLPIEWIVGDLDDHEALRRGCDRTDWVIHAAGKVKAPSYDAYYHANCVGTVNMLNAALAAATHLQRFVYLSSQAAGGPSEENRPRTEDDEPRPHTAYGRSKLAGEKEVMDRAGLMPVASLRPPAVYGPSDTEVLGFFQAVKWHIKPRFGHRSGLVSLVHVEDLVRGIVLACRSLAGRGKIFYIAEDQSYSLDELEDLIQAALGSWAVRVRIPRSLLMSMAWAAEMAGRVGGFTPKLNRDKARDFVQANWTCSTAKAQRLLGYHSQIPFAEGARQTVEWYRRNGWL